MGKYYVHIRKKSSALEPLKRGVLQGSMLGPVLFSIYTIELSKILLEIGVKFETFADDTQIYLTITNITATCIKLSEILTRIEAWMNFKQLKLNMNKTAYMLPC